MARDDRFVKVYTQGSIKVVEVLVDKETGVHYLSVQNGYAGGLTPLLDRDGKPVVGSIGDFNN